MKKLSTLLLALASVSIAFAQTQLVADFETVTPSWDQVNTSYMITSNPSETGLNLSCNVLYTSRETSEVNWAGVLTRFSTPVTGYNYVHVLMYRNNTGTPNLKVSDSNARDIAPVSGTTIVANQWQDVVFDISYISAQGADFVFFMVDRSNSLSARAELYIDDVIFSNDATPRTVPNAQCSRPEPGADGYTLMWNEEFTEESFDLSAWNIETTASPANNELQYYSERGVSVEREPLHGKHCLVLTARKENMGGRQCTSGRVTTQNKILFQYGKIEARIWFPNTANGLWPAFWMMGNDISSVSWPACGETDIIELGNSGGFSGKQDRYFNGASHWGPAWNQHQQAYNSVTYPYSVEDGFHTFTCIWDANHVAMYVDLDSLPNAQPYYQLSIPSSTNPSDAGYYFHKQNFILLNLAIGGDFPGITNVNNITALADGPRKMYVDWVRVYQKGDAGEQFLATSASDPVEELDPDFVALDDVSLSASAVKYIQDGRLVIERDGRRYDVLGRAL